MASTLSSLRLLPLVSLFLAGVTALPSSRRQTAPSFTSLGCVTDNAGGVRALSGASFATADMTVEKCAAFCSKFQLFGVEYGIECYCGNTRAGSSTGAPLSDCSFPCPGNSAQKCGAGDRLNLYQNTNPSVRAPASLPGITSLGCFQDTGARVLPNKIIGADDMTAAKCAENCAGYPYFGTQWSRECYCGTEAPTLAAPASECNMPCSGNDNELCGAGMRLNVYSFGAAEATSTSTSSTVASSTSTSSAPAATSTSSTTGIDGYEYQGCYTDNVPHHVLAGKVVFDGAMTLAKCAASCKASGYGVFGVEYGSECYCGAKLDDASTKVAESDCSMPCSGDASEKCGNGNRLSVYADPSVIVTPPSSPATAGAFSYQSCWIDNLGDRSLKAVDYRTDDMTVEKCADRCQGYFYFGVQYGRECYCGDALGGVAAPERDCSMLCVGDKTELCGGPARLNLYSKATTSSTLVTSTVSTTSEAESSTVEPEVSSTTDVEASTTSEAETSTTEPETVISTTTEASTSETSTVPSSTTTFPSSTTSTVSSTTQPPSLTTITSCPSTSTYNGVPEMCYQSLPEACRRLNSALPNRASMSSSLGLCKSALTSYALTPVPAASACFPANWAANPPAASATSTIRSVYSCLQAPAASVICQSASSCSTNTYPVTAVPSPTPSLGVDLIKDGGFETGSRGLWTVKGTNLNDMGITHGVSTVQKKSGTYSYRINFVNFFDASITLERVVRVEPGKQYRFTVPFWHQRRVGSFTILAYPVGASNGGAISPSLPNSSWNERAVTFTATSSWVQLQIVYTATQSGGLFSSNGQNTIYVDDATFVRTA
ncbi:WSC domain-containing protein [Podospora australis]|uniref:WSC domain-containing protein n=1 Tax=Podospora australis TaxID=1536484 RepID=A0AAN6WMC1_9PEZI|nr:WSC domain-containing protein [Podospora australis]